MTTPFTPDPYAAALAAAHEVHTREESDRLLKTYRLLFGKGGRRRQPMTRVELHERIVAGVPYGCLFHLTEELHDIPEKLVAETFTISTRTQLRHKERPETIMPPDLGSKTWMLAEIVAMAEDVMGSRKDAEKWLLSPAMGLNGSRPIDLLRTQQGAQLVSEFLERLRHGVYT
jgi:putative toxin-antitoxin system antitoxin component (TIGR02293 family)